MKKLLIFYFALFFSCSANAQFGDLLKGLEKIAKELGGDNQQQSQPQQESTINKQTQPELKQDSNNLNSAKERLVFSNADEMIKTLNGTWSRNCSNASSLFLKMETKDLSMGHKNIGLQKTWSSYKDGTEKILQSGESKFFKTLIYDPQSNRVQYDWEKMEADGKSAQYNPNNWTIEIIDNNKFKIVEWREYYNPIIRNGIIVKTGLESAPWIRCNVAELSKVVSDEKNSAQIKQKQADQNTFEKGRQIAKMSGVKWVLYTKKDEMSGRDSRFARLQVKNQQGASATADLSCDGMRITFEKGEVPMVLRGANRFATESRVKVNDYLVKGEIFQKEFKNVFYPNFFLGIGVGKFKNGRLFIIYTSGEELVYDWMVEVSTSLGPILIKAPPFDQAIESVLQSCK
jgi:hypothetical protein